MEEDMILPDDFQVDQPQSEETSTETVENDGFEPMETTEEAPTNEVTDTETSQEPIKIPVKYNKETMEIPIDEAAPWIQKGMNYDKTLERLQALESDPRLALIDELAQANGMEWQDYVQQVRQNQWEQQLDQLVQQNIPEEYAREMLENREFRQNYQREQQQKQQEAKQQAEFQDFFKYFREANGRDFVPETDGIPDSVWQANQQGIPLRYAYAEHENQQLRQQLATFQKNADNAKKAPVNGVTSHGSTEIASEDPFLKGFNSF